MGVGDADGDRDAAGVGDADGDRDGDGDGDGEADGEADGDGDVVGDGDAVGDADVGDEDVSDAEAEACGALCPVEEPGLIALSSAVCEGVGRSLAGEARCPGDGDALARPAAPGEPPATPPLFARVEA